MHVGRTPTQAPRGRTRPAAREGAPRGAASKRSPFPYKVLLLLTVGALVPLVAALSVELAAPHLDGARVALWLIVPSTLITAVAIWAELRRELELRERRHASMLEERKELQAAVESRMAQLSELSSYLQELSEAEKTKLSRDIHDELGSILVAAKMDVAWTQDRVKAADAKAAEKLGNALQVLDQAIAIKRRLTEELRPTLLDNLGLGAAIQWHVSEVCERAGLAHDVNVPEEEPEMPENVTVALFRIVQEGLTNVVRYAKARKVTVAYSLGQRGAVLIVADDGVGLPAKNDEKKLSHGILGMQQRVHALRGEIVLRSAPGQGTTIEVFVPLRRRSRPGNREVMVLPTPPASRGEPRGSDAQPSPAISSSNSRSRP